MRCVALGLLALGSCHYAAVDPPPSPAPPIPPIDVALTEPQFLPPLHLQMQTFALGAPDITTWTVDLPAVAQHGIQRGDDTLRWVLRGDDTLAAFRAEHGDGWQLTRTTIPDVCGHTVPALIAERPARHITCVMTPTGNFPAYDPAMRILAFELEGHGVPVLARFELESDTPAAWQPAIDAMVTSLRCVPYPRD